MEITKDTVVRFHYTIFDDSGTQLETSLPDNSTLYLHGTNSVLPKLQEAFAGHKAGDSLNFTLTTAQAYGERDENRTQRISTKSSRHLGRYKAGDVVPVNTDQSQQCVSVVKKGLKIVAVDRNHPLAGKTLPLRNSIEELRAATEEGLARGQAPGGRGGEH